MNHEEHEDHEGKKMLGDSDSEGRAGVEPVLGMRLASPLSPDAERAMTATIGCAIAVHRALGPGFLESIYKKAMHIELEARRIKFEHERPLLVNYRGCAIPGQRVDLIVEGLIVVELKAVARLDDVHRAQLISYLRSSGLRGGLLVNFRVSVLQRGLQRIVL